MTDLRPALQGPRWLGIGTRRAVGEAQALDYAYEVLKPALYPVMRLVPLASKGLVLSLVRSLMRWGFDMPGEQEPWGVCQTVLARLYEALENIPQVLGSSRRAGAMRYQSAEQLPAALCACLCVDALSTLSQYRVEVQDATTQRSQVWTVWHGPLLSTLLSHQTKGTLPAYRVLPQATPVWLPDRAGFASWIIPHALWYGINANLTRMLVHYIAQPAVTLTALHHLLHEVPSVSVVYLDILIQSLLRGKLVLNKVPGHVFVLPELTFCVATRVLQVLSDETGEAPEHILWTLQKEQIVFPERYALRLPADDTHPRSIELHGFAIPHAVLALRCVTLGMACEALPWASTPPLTFPGVAQVGPLTLAKERANDAPGEKP